MTASAIDSSRNEATGYRQLRFRITADDRAIARYTVAAVTLSLLDWSIPLPIPGVKPGLANIAILIAFSRLGWRAAISVALFRVLVVSLLVGTFLSPGFWLSFSGSLFSLAALAATRLLPSRHFSAITQSVAAAFAHMAGQLVVVDWLLFPIDAILPLLPIFFAGALITGIVNGSIAAHWLDGVSKTAASP